MHYKKSVFRSLAMITQLGLCVITPVFLCVFIGYQVDSHLGGSVMIPMVILGVLSGGRCAWGMAKRTLEQEKKEDERIRKERTARITFHRITPTDISRSSRFVGLLSHIIFRLPPSFYSSVPPTVLPQKYGWTALAC